MLAPVMTPHSIQPPTKIGHTHMTATGTKLRPFVPRVGSTWGHCPLHPTECNNGLQVAEHDNGMETGTWTVCVNELNKQNCYLSIATVLLLPFMGSVHKQHCAHLHTTECANTLERGKGGEGERG